MGFLPGSCHVGAPDARVRPLPQGGVRAACGLTTPPTRTHTHTHAHTRGGSGPHTCKHAHARMRPRPPTHKACIDQHRRPLTRHFATPKKRTFLGRHFAMHELRTGRVGNNRGRLLEAHAWATARPPPATGAAARAPQNACGAALDPGAWEGAGSRAAPGGARRPGSNARPSGGRSETALAKKSVFTTVYEPRPFSRSWLSRGPALVRAPACRPWAAQRPAAAPGARRRDSVASRVGRCVSGAVSAEHGCARRAAFPRPAK
ncbi:MAG: hypothetical protein J3K34DRAFT_55201 [Monoraphidium minutum]|nr:MAG: hypothetical protein J3K34DRAFT_55201 [Monoraphidium minutum]